MAQAMESSLIKTDGGNASPTVADINHFGFRFNPSVDLKIRRLAGGEITVGKFELNTKEGDKQVQRIVRGAHAGFELLQGLDIHADAGLAVESWELRGRNLSRGMAGGGFTIGDLGKENPGGQTGIQRAEISSFDLDFGLSAHVELERLFGARLGIGEVFDPEGRQRGALVAANFSLLDGFAASADARLTLSIQHAYAEGLNGPMIMRSGNNVIAMIE